MKHLPRWYKRGPNQQSVNSVSCIPKSHLHTYSSYVVTTRCYFEKERQEHVCRVNISRINQDYQYQIEQCVAIHAVEWKTRGLWDFDLAMYALIYDYHDLYDFLTQDMEPPVFRMSMERELEATLLNGSLAAAEKFLAKWPNWRDKYSNLNAREELSIFWRFYGSTQSSALYDKQILSQAFQTDAALVDSFMLAHAKNPCDDDTINVIDDFVVDQLSSWLFYHYDKTSFCRAAELLLTYWKAVFPMAPLRLSQISEEDSGKFVKLFDTNWIPLVVRKRIGADTVTAMIAKFFVDDRIKTPE